ncbi:DsrE/DsrF/TusD sulfur relay family protein [Elusimicrobiota bacterium]
MTVDTNLIIFNSNPYDGSDVTWNGLRLAEKLLDLQLEVKIFLMNDSVDLAREACSPPEGYYDLVQMLKNLIDKEVEVGVCGTCKARCGLYKGEPYFMDSMEAKMTDLAEWVKEANKVISF